MPGNKKTILKTKSEKLFQSYLQSNRLRNFEYEPKLPGSKKPPDFCLYYGRLRIVFQVKELGPRKELPDGPFDPHLSVKAKIEEAWRQLRDFPDECCCIVLHDLGYGPPVLTKDIVYGTMLGKLKIFTPFDPRLGSLTDKSFTAFSNEGGEVRWESGEPHKSNVSAIIVLEHLNVGEMRFLAIPTRAQRGSCRAERFAKAWEEAKLARRTQRDVSLRELRVVVYKNPYANKKLPGGAFCGAYDERYGRRGKEIRRIFAGRGIRKLERKRQVPKSPLDELVKRPQSRGAHSKRRQVRGLATE